ncbi:hypothetical protein OAK15_03300 [Verrucomicrobia bacterium]|nr:hypothetical protein [Verrucomicrobiota bacterium]
MSDLSDFSKTLPQLETVDVESIPSGIEPGSSSARMKFGEAVPPQKKHPQGLVDEVRQVRGVDLRQGP